MKSVLADQLRALDSSLPAPQQQHQQQQQKRKKRAKRARLPEERDGDEGRGGGALVRRRAEQQREQQQREARLERNVERLLAQQTAAGADAKAAAVLKLVRDTGSLRRHAVPEAPKKKGPASDDEEQPLSDEAGAGSDAEGAGRAQDEHLQMPDLSLFTKEDSEEPFEIYRFPGERAQAFGVCVCVGLTTREPDAE